MRKHRKGLVELAMAGGAGSKGFPLSPAPQDYTREYDFSVKVVQLTIWLRQCLQHFCTYLVEYFVD